MNLSEQLKDTIIQIICRDMQHRQLTHRLELAGLATDKHQWDMLEIVAKLSSIQPSDELGTIYDRYLEMAQNRDITANGDELRVIAEECYNFILEHESNLDALYR